MLRYIQSFFIFCLSFVSISSQTSYTDYKLTPREYILAGISIEGVSFLDHEVVIQKSGLQRGEKIAIPSDKISKAIEEKFYISRDDWLHRELSTPRAFERWTNRPRGIVGGIGQNPEVFGLFGLYDG